MILCHRESWSINIHDEPSAVEPVIVNIQAVFPVAAAPLCSMAQGHHQACALETNTAFVSVYLHGMVSNLTRSGIIRKWGIQPFVSVFIFRNFCL